MKQLKSFILGILTIILFIPIIEQICEIVVTGLEYIKGLTSKSVLKINKDLQELQVDLQKVDDGVAMGFQYNGDDEYDYDEFDDDFEDKKNNKIKIGFH